MRGALTETRAARSGRSSRMRLYSSSWRMPSMRVSCTVTFISFANEMNVTVQETLIEGMRQLDEYNRIRDDLPDLAARVSVSAPLIPPLRDLKPQDLDVLQLAHNYG